MGKMKVTLKNFEENKVRGELARVDILFGEAKLCLAILEKNKELFLPTKCSYLEHPLYGILAGYSYICLGEYKLLIKPYKDYAKIVTAEEIEEMFSNFGFSDSEFETSLDFVKRTLEINLFIDYKPSITGNGLLVNKVSFYDVCRGSHSPLLELTFCEGGDLDIWYAKELINCINYTKNPKSSLIELDSRFKANNLQFTCNLSDEDKGLVATYYFYISVKSIDTMMSCVKAALKDEEYDIEYTPSPKKRGEVVGIPMPILSDKLVITLARK